MNFITLFFKKLLRYLLKPLSFIPAILMMYLIFHFSAQTGNESGNISLKVSKIAVLAYNKVCIKDYDNATLNQLITIIHPYVRKFAHISEYFLLAISVSFPLYVYRLRGIYLTLIAGSFCVLFSAFDEYHQTFVSGRVGTSKDVMIDSIGILIGIILVRIIGFIGRKTVFSWLSLDKKGNTTSRNGKHK